MIIGQPAHEITDLIQLVGVDAQVDLIQPRLEVADLAFHGSEITDHLAHIGQHA